MDRLALLQVSHSIMRSQAVAVDTTRYWIERKFESGRCFCTKVSFYLKSGIWMNDLKMKDLACRSIAQFSTLGEKEKDLLTQMVEKALFVWQSHVKTEPLATEVTAALNTQGFNLLPDIIKRPSYQRIPYYYPERTPIGDDVRINTINQLVWSPYKAIGTSEQLVWAPYKEAYLQYIAPTILPLALWFIDKPATHPEYEKRLEALNDKLRELDQKAITHLKSLPRLETFSLHVRPTIELKLEIKAKPKGAPLEPALEEASLFSSFIITYYNKIAGETGGAVRSGHLLLLMLLQLNNIAYINNDDCHGRWALNPQITLPPVSDAVFLELKEGQIALHAYNIHHPTLNHALSLLFTALHVFERDYPAAYQELVRQLAVYRKPLDRPIVIKLGELDPRGKSLKNIILESISWALKHSSFYGPVIYSAAPSYNSTPLAPVASDDHFSSYTRKAVYLDEYFLHALFFTACKEQHRLLFDKEELLINPDLYHHLIALSLFDTFLYSSKQTQHGFFIILPNQLNLIFSKEYFLDEENKAKEKILGTVLVSDAYQSDPIYLHTLIHTYFAAPEYRELLKDFLFAESRLQLLQNIAEPSSAVTEEIALLTQKIKALAFVQPQTKKLLQEAGRHFHTSCKALLATMAGPSNFIQELYDKLPERAAAAAASRITATVLPPDAATVTKDIEIDVLHRTPELARRFPLKAIKTRGLERKLTPAMKVTPLQWTTHFPTALAKQHTLVDCYKTNGMCLYEVLAFLVFEQSRSTNLKEQAIYLKECLALYLENNADRYLHLFEAKTEAELLPTLLSYAQKMKEKMPPWCSDIELQLLSDILGLPIEAWYYDKEQNQIPKLVLSGENAGMILPSKIFGAIYTGEPLRVFVNYRHGIAMLPKSA